MLYIEHLHLFQAFQEFQFFSMEFLKNYLKINLFLYGLV